MSPQSPPLPHGAFPTPLAFHVLPKAVPEGAVRCQQPGGSSSFMSASNRRHVRARPSGSSSGAFVLKGSSPSLHRRVGWQSCRSLRTGAAVVLAAEVDSGVGEVAVEGQTLLLDAATAATADACATATAGVGTAAGTATAVATAAAATAVDGEEAVSLRQGQGKAMNGSSNGNINSNSKLSTPAQQQTRPNRQPFGSKGYYTASAATNTTTTITTIAPMAGGVATATRGRPLPSMTEVVKAEAALVKKKERQIASRASALMRRMTDAGKQGR